MRLYTIYRRKKKIQKLKLKQYAESQLVYRVYHTWLNKFELKKNENNMEMEIVSFKNWYLIARVFKMWQTQNEYRKNLRLREIKMKKFYEKKLKQKYFDALRSNYFEEKQIKLKLFPPASLPYHNDNYLRSLT